MERLNIIDSAEAMGQKTIEVSAKPINKPSEKKFNEQLAQLLKKVSEFPEKSHKIVSVKGKPQYDRMKIAFETLGLNSVFYDDETFDLEKVLADDRYTQIHFVPKKLKNIFQFPS